jgi:uncharacterized protein (TIGR02466 family)
VALHFDRTRDLAMTFATPVAQMRLDDASALNPALRGIILERAAAEAGQRRSNVGGWQSEGNLMAWPHPEIATLQRYLEQAVNHMTAAATRQSTFEARYRFTGWANVCRRGDYHKLHNHPDHHWSGVYYVAAGGADPERPQSGTFEIQDPRPFTEMVVLPGNPYGRTIALKPEAGLMLLFPSWLYHWVNPFTGDGERISIAFNARLVSFRPLEGGAAP